MVIKHRDAYLLLNIDLVKDQRVDFDTLCDIVSLSKERYDLFELLKVTKDKTLMRIIFVQLRNIEFELQFLWGFPENEIRHKSFYWPHCSCPQLDNRDGFPHVQWKDEKCPLHGPDLL